MRMINFLAYFLGLVLINAFQLNGVNNVNGVNNGLV